MLDFFAANPLIALAVILALGLALGKVKIFGFSLGTATVLFVALGFSAANPDIKLPPLIFQLGLAMFVYAIGLSAGPAFVREFRSRGWKLSLFVVLLLSGLVALSWVLIKLCGVPKTIGAGMFAGALSSTPGMAAIVETLSKIDPAQASEPVIGYSLAYPGGVIGPILIAALGAKMLKVNHVDDAKKEGMIAAPLVWKGLKIAPDVHGTIGDLSALSGQDIIATRIVTELHSHRLADPDVQLEPGMELVINGSEESVNRAIAKLGTEADTKIEDTDLVYSRFTVSNPDVVSRTIEDLETKKVGFMIARIRRGDQEIVPTKDTVLNYSDRVRAVAAPSRMNQVKQFLGDSERSLADVDLLPFAIGLSLGLLLGAIPIPLPGGTSLSLGFGGGPIVAGLILGAVNRTGPITWQLPFHANRTISTIGLSLFLAGVGTSAGGAFRSALSDPASLTYMCLGLLVTLVSAFISVLVCTKLLKLRWDEATGVAAGVTTNPAVISYINDDTGTDLANRGYATVYPAAMIGKILAAQILFILL